MKKNLGFHPLDVEDKMKDIENIEEFGHRSQYFFSLQMRRESRVKKEVYEMNKVIFQFYPQI